MRKEKIVCYLFVIALVAVLATGCSKKDANAKSNGTKEFTAFFAVPGSEINDDNVIQKKIAEKTGVSVKEVWLTGQTAEEAIGTFVAGGEYPDLIDGGGGSKQLYEAGALVALDDYIDKYPNIKNFFTTQQWNALKQDDGKIYWIPQFSNIKGEEKTCTHNGEAFWIQTRVLKWADYPTIRTMDQYFDLIEAYYAANPTMPDGTENIPYTILCDDWRYFCLENAPQFLDGYPNDGAAIVDPTTLEVIDYNTTDTAVAYFKKLNEEYHKGIVDAESFTQTYDEYIAKVSTGRVLGMIDQWWDFAYTAGDAIKQAGLDDIGCEYVPLPITISEDVESQWHCSGEELNVASGIAITTDCDDIEGALEFIDALLGQEVHDLRFWGLEGENYFVDDKGEFRRTAEMRDKGSNASYKAENICTYSYFPQYLGTSDDGINANKPEGQGSEFYDGLSDNLKETFVAYGAETYVDMIGVSEPPGPWYPVWSFAGTLTTGTEGGFANAKITEVKHEYLPRVVMAKNFDSAWDDYMDVYEKCNPESFINELQVEVLRRVEEAKKFQ